MFNIQQITDTNKALKKLDKIEYSSKPTPQTVKQTERPTCSSSIFSSSSFMSSGFFYEPETISGIKQMTTMLTVPDRRHADTCAITFNSQFKALRIFLILLFEELLLRSLSSRGQCYSFEIEHNETPQRSTDVEKDYNFFWSSSQ